MGTKRKTLHTAAVAFAFAAGWGVAAAEERGVTDTTIKIGNIGPFTGKAAIFNPLNYGSAAYMRYVNDLGGVYGRKFEIVFATPPARRRRASRPRRRWCTMRRSS